MSAFVKKVGLKGTESYGHFLSKTLSFYGGQQ